MTIFALMTPFDTKAPVFLHDAISLNIAQKNGKQKDAAARHENHLSKT